MKQYAINAGLLFLAVSIFGGCDESDDANTDRDAALVVEEEQEAYGQYAEEVAECLDQLEGCDLEAEGLTEECEAELEACRPEAPECRGGHHDRNHMPPPEARECFDAAQECIEGGTERETCVEEARACAEAIITERFEERCANAEERCAEEDANAEMCERIAEKCAQGVPPLPEPGDGGGPGGGGEPPTPPGDGGEPPAPPTDDE